MIRSIYYDKYGGGMYCPYCGNLIHPDSFSCPHCGSFVRSSDIQTPRSAAETTSKVSQSTTLANRLDEWGQLVATTVQTEAPTQRAGDQGEAWLQLLMGSSKSYKGADLFVGKRVPSGNMRREIDLILVTARRLYVFEVKNWSGRLRR